MTGQEQLAPTQPVTTGHVLSPKNRLAQDPTHTENGTAEEPGPETGEIPPAAPQPAVKDSVHTAGRTTVDQGNAKYLGNHTFLHTRVRYVQQISITGQAPTNSSTRTNRPPEKWTLTSRKFQNVHHISVTNINPY